MSARTPGRIGDPRQPGRHSTSLNLSSAGVEKRWEMSIWSALRMLTAKCSERLKAEQLRDARAIDHSSPLIKSLVVLSIAKCWAVKPLYGAICCSAHEAAAFCQRAATPPQGQRMN